MTYAAANWSLKVGSVRNLEAAQRAIERAMHRVYLKDNIQNEVILKE